MAKQPNPAKLIKERARKLPLYKCLVTPEWEESGMANVIIIRKHTNGNYTICFYLVDLQCLGVKNTFYLFNIDESEFADLYEFNDFGDLVEIDYNLAHNIIYAGYEFALDSGIQPHEDFEKTTKYMLEKDDENVPLIDIECGDNGVPHYMQTEEETASFAGKVIRSLEKNVGEGNFYVTRYDEMEEEEMAGDEDDFEEIFDKNKEFLKEIEEQDLGIEEIAYRFAEFFDREEKYSKDDKIKFSSYLFLLTKYYTSEERFDELAAIWRTDMEISPSFEYEEGLSEETNRKIDGISRKKEDEFTTADNDFLKENLNDQALAEYIILSISEPESDPDNPEPENKKSKAFDKKVREAQKKYGDSPLFMLRRFHADPNLEEFTIEKIFGKDYALSIFEFREYLFLKLTSLFLLSDMTALIVFDSMLDQISISDDFFEILKESLDKFQVLTLAHNITEDFIES